MDVITPTNLVDVLLILPSNKEPYNTALWTRKRGM